MKSTRAIALIIVFGTAESLASQPTPDVGVVQRAVLAYLELSPSRIADIERRARRAALWPQVRATFALDRERARSREHDQTFSSGSIRDLRDSDAQRDDDLGLQLQLVWDLDRLASPDDAIDVSRERRELIELRDQVLERVNRLYFDRLRVVSELSATSPGDRVKRASLRLRVRELEAALDGWTGGLYTRLEPGTRAGRELE